MFRINKKSIAPKRKGFCTIAELISGEVRDELVAWAYFMRQHFKDLPASKAMRHDSHQRHRGALRQRRWGIG